MHQSVKLRLAKPKEILYHEFLRIHDIIDHVRFGISRKFRTAINSCGAI